MYLVYQIYASSVAQAHYYVRLTYYVREDIYYLIREIIIAFNSQHNYCINGS